jgi:IS5 family transposase
MVKLLLLQPVYTLSDDALEYQVLDHTSFQRFLGLEHSGRVPGAGTVWVWRERLKQHDLIGDIVPEEGTTAKRAQKDVDARWTKKHGKSFYGYRLHANTDRRWGFVRQHKVSAAQVHDSQHFETILDPANTGRTIRADSAYADQHREAELKYGRAGACGRGDRLEGSHPQPDAFGAVETRRRGARMTATGCRKVACEAKSPLSCPR